VNALVATHDLSNKNRHLMPWRTVCEVVNHASAQNGSTRLVSLGIDQGQLSPDEIIPRETTVIAKNRGKLRQGLDDCLARYNPNVIYWPLAWREPSWRLRLLGSLAVPIIGYFPGGDYRLRHVLYATRRIGWKATLPYLCEAVSPKSFTLRRLKRAGVRKLIAMTAHTARCAVRAGWPTKLVQVIPPGRDDHDVGLFGEAALAKEFVEWRRERPYYVFLGPPSAIRGIFELLEAFDRAADCQGDLCLVCLFRSDAELDAEKIRQAIKDLRHRDRVHAVWRSVSRETLSAFVRHSHGAVLPYVLVPSEIPLAVIEIMGFGKPVITTAGKGTGQFVEQFGLVTQLGHRDALANALVQLVVDQPSYRQACSTTLASFGKHPRWSDVSRLWLMMASDLT
jgi:glycosyltransferase involved in cell wall biosynthesis